MVESQSHHWNPCDTYQCSLGDTGKWYDSWLDDLPMASHLIRCGTQVSPLGVPGWLSLSNYKPSTQSTSSSSRNADKTVQFKRVKQSPNISQKNCLGIFCGILWRFFTARQMQCPVLCRVNLDTFQSFLQEGVVSSKGTCLNASREYFPRFQGGLSNTVRCSFICISITFRHPKTFIFRGFDYVSFRLKVKTVSSRDLPVTEWNWWSHWNLVGCLAQTSESRHDEKKKPEQGRLSFFPKPFLKME